MRYVDGRRGVCEDEMTGERDFDKRYRPLTERNPPSSSFRFHASDQLNREKSKIIPQTKLPVTSRIGIPVSDGGQPALQQGALDNVVGKSRHGAGSQ